MLISGYDYIQFLTETLTSHLNESNETKEAPQQKKKDKQVTTSHPWFGLLPFAFKTMLKKK